MTGDPLSEEQLRELREDLEQLQRQLRGQLERIGDDSQPVQLDQQMVGRLSRMDAMQQQQMARASQSHMRAHLSRVSLALKAMEEGEFGYCKSCDEPIGFARLKVRPDSPLCIACQQHNEQQ
jgi:DnaK suppressor protein